MALLPPQFLDSVVAVGTRDEDDVAWNASGFLYGHLSERIDDDRARYLVYLVSNRHVLHGHDSLWLRFNPTGNEPAKEYELVLTAPDGLLWFPHPDEDVDVGVAPINAKALRDDGIQFSYFTSDVSVAPRNVLSERGVAEGDGVFVLGFPMGLVGGARNAVIARGGCVARIQDALTGASKDFLIDAPIFPGNSGSPVVLRPEISSITGTNAQDNAVLLGVVKSYIPYHDVAISQQTQRPRVVFEENSGLASVELVDAIQTCVRSHLKTQPEAVPPETATPEPTEASADPDTPESVESSSTEEPLVQS